MGDGKELNDFTPGYEDFTRKYVRISHVTKGNIKNINTIKSGLEQWRL